MVMSVVTRFAPSPTGYLHIGSARTALFNYLFAKSKRGKFLLRIENTDKKRSTIEYEEAIVNSLKWLNIKWDNNIVFQADRINRHLEIANYLVRIGAAYRCFVTAEELKEWQEKKGIIREENFLYKSPWRDVDPKDYPKNKKSVIRFKTPMIGLLRIKDEVQGEITIRKSTLTDLILVRSDNTPTYMLSVVVDDHDMGVTHIIRGSDHLSNVAVQQLIYQALNWTVPVMVHVPLIHTVEGKKLSKRGGSMDIQEYKNKGYLANAMNNYLLRLGWGHGNKEIISMQEAIALFNLRGLGKSPARFDSSKLKQLNSFYLRESSNELLLNYIIDYYNSLDLSLSNKSISNIKQAMDSIKIRSELVTDLYDLAKIYIIDYPIEILDSVQQIILSSDKDLVTKIIYVVQDIEKFDKSNIEKKLKEFAKKINQRIGQIMLCIRLYITGRVNSPSVFEVMSIIGKEETLRRLLRNKDD